MAEPKKTEASEETIGLHTLKPAEGSRKTRKRVGRGHGSGMGKTSGRGQKGAGSRSGSKSRANFEGGQMPIHMRMRKLRGPHTQPVNLGDLEKRFEAGDEVTPETLAAAGLATRKGIDVKILAKGSLSKKLTVRAHKFSAAAREAIESAGGTVEFLDGEPEAKPERKAPAPVAEAPEPEATEPEATEPEATEPEAVEADEAPTEAADSDDE